MLPISSVYAAENGDVAPKSVTSSSARVRNELFRAMYDSDGLFLEEAEEILEWEVKKEENFAHAAAQNSPLLNLTQTWDTDLVVQREECPGAFPKLLLDMLEKGDAGSLAEFPLEEEWSSLSCLPVA